MQHSFRRFYRDDRASIAMIFGLSLLPVLGLVGASVDYSRAALSRSTANAAVDAAALATVKATGTFAQRKEVGEKVLRANIAAADFRGAYTLRITQVMQDGVETAVRVTLETQVKTSVLSVFGQRYIEIASAAEAKNASNEAHDIAFVLDTTDSMRGDRIVSLKAATTSLIDDFMARQTTPDMVRVSVVPFAQYVNIGLSNRNQPWLDVPNDYQEPIREECSMVREVVGRNCQMVTVPADPGSPGRPCMQDGVMRTCGARPPRPAFQQQQCTNINGPNMVRQCRNVGGNWVRWNGCVGSRVFPNELLDANYAIKIPGLMGVTCGTPVLAPTSNLAQAKSMIQNLTTSGETYLPAGLIWGWRMLSTRAPFESRAGTAALPVKRHMILVTDGQNTKSPNYPRHEGNSTALANNLTRGVCQNMALDTETKLTLYTIAFEVGDPVVKDILRECSTLNGGQFFDAANASQLQEALKHIGRSMSAMRLSK